MALGKYVSYAKRLAVEDSGAEMVEYALVLGLIAIAAVVAVGAVGSSAKNVWNNISSTLAANGG